MAPSAHSGDSALMTRGASLRPPLGRAAVPAAERASPPSRRTRALRVLIVSQYYAPEQAEIPTLLAESLAERGHNVHVLTGYPNYPSGEVFEGYRMRWSLRERIGAVWVHRVPLYANHSRSATKRIGNYLSFALTAGAQWKLALGADVVYVYATQMTPAAGPAAWRMLKTEPFVLHVQDLWPDSIAGSGMLPAPLARAASAVMTPWLRAVYGRAAATIGISTRMSATLVERGVPAERSRTVLNWADETLEVLERNRPSDAIDGGTLRFVFAGNLGELQDLDTVIRAAAALRDEPRFELEIYGGGIAEPRLRRLADDLGASNVHFRGVVPASHMPAVYAASDFQIISLADLPAMRGTIPSKLPNSLRHGVPVITAVAGAVEEIVRERAVGFSVPPGDAPALTAAFRVALATSASTREQMRRRAKAAYAAEMSLVSGIDAIERILIDAASERTGTR